MKGLKYAGIALAVIVVLAVLIGIVAERVLVARKLDPILAGTAENIGRAWPRVEEDIHTLGAHAFFNAERRPGDAGAFLNPMLTWNGARDQRDGALRTKLAALPEPVRLLAEAGVEPEREITPELADQLRAIDFGWLKALHQWGHWSLVTDSPWDRMNPVLILSAPLPDFMVLIQWAKLRLYQGKVAGELAEATRDVKQLAYLCLTTENLVGAMVGVSHLELAVDFSTEAGLSAEDTDRMKRAFFAAPAFATWAAPAEARARYDALVRRELPLARCLAWSEGAMHYAIRPFVQNRFEGFYAELDGQKPGSGCRFDMLTRVRAQFLADPYALLRNDVDDTETGDRSAMLAQVPIVRGIVGVILLSIASPDWLARYGDDD